MLKKDENPDLPPLNKVKPLPPEKAEEALSEMGQNFWYGEGVGNAAMTAGSIVLFPPYAVMVLGNAALSLGGYESIWLSDALPDEAKEEWRSVYGTVASAPGEFNAALAKEEFRNKDLAAEKIKPFIQETISENGRIDNGNDRISDQTGGGGGYPER